MLPEVSGVFTRVKESVMYDDCCVMSPHEQALMEQGTGVDVAVKAKHPRLFALIERFDGRAPVIDIERARLFTESMRATEGKPLVLRWALAMKHIAEHITVYVDDLQLLAGRCGPAAGRYGIL